jgi:cytochrome c5
MGMKAMRKDRFFRPVFILLPLAAVIATSEHVAAQSDPKAAAALTTQATFTKDVAPIFQRSCQTCHRPDSFAPMSLLTYEDARPWAKAIKENIVKRNMPPWHIDRNVGISEFANSVALTDDEIATIVNWVDGGAPKGNPADMPPARQFSDDDKWSIGTPDLVVQWAKDVVVPAKSPDIWTNIPVDLRMTEDRYVKAVEVKAIKGLKALHHSGATAMYPEGGQAYLQSYGIGNNGHEFEEGSGIIIKAGTKVNFSAHLHAYGQETPVNAAIAFKFYPKGYVPTHVALTEMMGDDAELDLPPNSDNVRTDTYRTFMKPTRLLSFQPHMHTRGKAMCVEAIYPGGGTRPGSRVETLSCVSNYKFNWMINYEYASDVQPLLPAGTVLHFIGWHDNSSNNRANNDPDNWIGYGQRTIDDMSHAWITYYTLSDEEFKKAAAERKVLEQTKAKAKGKNLSARRDVPAQRTDD